MARAPWLPQPQQTTQPPPTTSAVPTNDPSATPSPPPPPAGNTRAPWLGPEVDTVSDVWNTIKGAPRRLVEGMVGTGGDLPAMGGKALGWVSQQLGIDPTYAAGFGPAVSTIFNPMNTINAAMQEKPTVQPLPSTADVTQATTPLFGPRYQPQTDMGRKAEIVSDFATNALQPGPGWMKAAAVGVPSALTMAADYLPERWQPAAKFGAAFTGMPFTRIKSPEQIADIKSRVGPADDFGIPLTKGERTGNPAQQKLEQQIMHGAKGGGPMRKFGSFMEAREAQRAAAKANLQERMAPGTGESMTAASDLGFTARRFVERNKTEGAKLIDNAIKEGVWIDAQRLNRAPGEIAAKLEGTTPGVPNVVLDDLTPTARKAMSLISKMAGETAQTAADPMARMTGAPPPPQVKEVSLAGAEQLRRNLGAMKGTTPEDIRALTKLRRYYDEWMQDAVDNGIIRVGNGQGGGRTPDQVLADLKTGRSKYKAGIELEEPRKGEEGGKSVAKIVGETATPEEIKKLLSPDKQGQMSLEAPHTLSRLIDKFGADSDVVNNARAIVMDNLMQGGPQQTAGNLRRFMENSPTTAGKLFTPEQLDKLRSYQGVNESMVPTPTATNPSKSGYQFADIAKLASGGGTGAVIGAAVGRGAEALGMPFGREIGTLVGGGIGLGANTIKNNIQARRALAQLPEGWDKLPPAQQQRWVLAQIAAMQGADRRNRRNE